jgi:predicted permease
MLQDLRLAFRMLRRNPGVSFLAILCLTLGIGATTSVFSWIEGILLRPFPAVANQDRLVAMVTINRGTRSGVSWPDFEDFRRNSKLAEAFICDRIFGTTLAIGDRAERATGSVVSANYFDALGIKPILGRTFEPAEETGRNAHPVTVISYQAWQDRYHADPNIIGRTQMLTGVKHTIIGVAPEGFYGTFVGYSFQFWVPVSMQEVFDAAGGYKMENRGARWIEGFVKMKAGVTIEQMQSEMSAIAGRLDTAYPATNRGRDIQLYPLWATPFNGAGTMLPTLRVSLVVAAFVLLIACANVGNLLLVRSFARRHEMTIRLAVGAGRGRLLQQLLTEGLVLSALAVSGGLLVANWCRNLIKLLTPTRPGVIIHMPAEIDWRVLALSAGVCLIATLLLGLAPGWQATKVDLAAGLKAEAGGVIGGKGRAWMRSSLVMVQVSLSFVLLVGTGLLLESMSAMRNASPGFSTNVLATNIDLRGAGYDQPRARNFQDELIDRLQSTSGVQSAAFSRLTPFTYGVYSSAPIAVEGYETAPEEQPLVDYSEVGPGYLATMGIPLVAGREFTRADNETAPLVAVVNEPMATQFWRGQDPVGRRFKMQNKWIQVAGVAKLSKYRNLTEVAKPFFYVPTRQAVTGAGLEIRTTLSADTMAKILAREIHALDANVAPGEVLTMREQVDRMSWSQRAAVILLAVFGGMALVLAAVGLYGVMSYAVSQSTRELGLRMALGADARDLLKMVMSHGVLLTAAGVLIGGAAAMGLTRLLGDLLYGVSPRDPVAFAVAMAVMVVASISATLVPAWRASRTDPVKALR